MKKCYTVISEGKTRTFKSMEKAQACVSKLLWERKPCEIVVKPGRF